MQDPYFQYFTAFPTDAKLLEVAIRQLGKLAKQHEVPLRQSYGRLAKRAAMMAGRNAHGRRSSSAGTSRSNSCARAWAGSFVTSGVKSKATEPWKRSLPCR